MTQEFAIVGTMRVSVNPARPYSERNSASDRWCPPVQTSILTSFEAAETAGERIVDAGRIHALDDQEFPRAAIARRQFRRIVRARASSQSGMTCFSTYASPPGGTSAKKSPLTEGGGLVDATGRWLVGAKGEVPDDLVASPGW
jgi:hypothetical protein